MNIKRSKLYTASRGLFLHGFWLVLVFTFLSGWGGWQAGGGHGTFGLFAFALSASCVAWLMLVISAVMAAILKWRREIGVWWLSPCVIATAALPFVWYWWVRDGFWTVF
jgi:hypothetical protein